MSAYTPEQWARIDADAAIMRRKARRHKFLETVGNHSILVVMSAIFIMPLYLIVVISLMSIRHQ